MLTKNTSIPRVNILITDDHPMFRNGVKMTLENISFVREIHEAASGNEALQMLNECQIDIILMDITMNDGDGIETSKIISEKYPDIGVIALSMHEDEKNIASMIEAGALGYLFKNTNEDELREAIVAVYNRGNYFTPQSTGFFLQKLLKKKADPASENFVPELSDREKEVLQLLCEEKLIHEIAELLSLSKRTIEGHKENLMRKTNSKNLIGLYKYAVKEGIVEKEK